MSRVSLFFLAIIFISVGLFLYVTKKPMISPQGKSFSTLSITSPEFRNGGRIPERYTCDGENISPPLFITGVPKEARTLALLMDDPDSPSGTWDHWVVFNIPAQSVLIKSISPGEEPPGVAGSNTWGNTGYGGPCPGIGEHRYQFKLYALDKELFLTLGASKTEVVRAMSGHILESAELLGQYQRVR